MEGYLGEIRLWGPQWAPRNWALCDGQILPINQYQSLYSILGTQYGGDGRTTFALPDLRGRVSIHHGDDLMGNDYNIGQKGGSEQVVLNINEMPAHNHSPKGMTGPGNEASPANGFPAESSEESYNGNTNIQMAATTNTGGGQGHENRQPYQVCSYIICLSGQFPSRN